MDGLRVFLCFFPPLGGPQSCWKSLVGTSLQLSQPHPCRPASPSPGLGTRTGTGTGTESRRLPAAACLMLPPRPAASRARTAGPKYEPVSEFLQRKCGLLRCSLKRIKAQIIFNTADVREIPQLLKKLNSNHHQFTTRVKLIRINSRHHPSISRGMCLTVKQLSR